MFIYDNLGVEIRKFTKNYNMEPKKPISFDIKKMSEKTHLPVLFIKSMLGIPLKGRECKAVTPSQARDLYNKSKVNSERRAIIFEKWNELSLIEARQAKTLVQSKLAYENSPHGGEAAELALKKYIGFITEIKDAQAIFYSSQKNPKIKSLAFKKLDKIAAKKVKSVNTFDEILSVYHLSPTESKAQLLAVKKIATSFGWE